MDVGWRGRTRMMGLAATRILRGMEVIFEKE